VTVSRSRIHYGQLSTPVGAFVGNEGSDSTLKEYFENNFKYPIFELGPQTISP